MVSTQKHAVQAPHEVVGCGLQSSGQFLQLKVEHGELLKSLRVLLLDYGGSVQIEPAGECKGELVERRQTGQQHRHHDGVAEQ